MSTSPLTYTVHARTDGDGVATAAADGKTAEIAFDASAGQRPDLLGPAELLLAAFAACSLKNVERMSGMQRFAYQSASIEVTGEREEKPPRMARIRYTLRVVTDEPQHRVDLLHRNVTGYGTIFNTMAAACEISGEIVAVPTGAA
jgi:uncharacterized OsmC-like protein